MVQLLLGDWARRLVYLVGCGKSKLTKMAKAKDLYTGNLFKAARRHAERSAPTWRVLSALYGLLDPERRIAPYNRKMGPRDEDRAAWARSAAATFVNVFGTDCTVVCLAGEDYAWGICSMLEGQGIPCSTPLTGLGVGKRLAWFKDQAQQ